MSNYESNHVIANGYGLPFLFESKTSVPENVEISIRRIAVLNQQVVNWISLHKRIPTSNPNASSEERAMAHWLRVCQFYANIAVDYQEEHKDELESNNQTHERCQHLILHWSLPESEDFGESPNDPNE